MAEPPFNHLDEMYELQKEIRQKGKLEIGDPHVVRYNLLYSQVAKHMPQTEEAFVRFISTIHADYERWLEVLMLRCPTLISSGLIKMRSL